MIRTYYVVVVIESDPLVPLGKENVSVAGLWSSRPGLRQVGHRDKGGGGEYWIFEDSGGDSGRGETKRNVPLLLIGREMRWNERSLLTFEEEGG